MEWGAHRWVACSSLPEAQRLEAAELAADALAQLYDGLRQEAVPLLASEFCVEGELSQALALMGSRVDGLVASYPANEYGARQRISLHHLLGGLSRGAAANFVCRLQQLSKDLPGGALSGEYIARFTVRQELRGSGLADRLMSRFVADHPLASLHVRAGNRRAITFYRRHGFTPVSESPEFLLMQRG